MRFTDINDKVNQLGLETLGISRLSSRKRDTSTFKLFMVFFWLSAAGSLETTWTYFLGPISVRLSMKDALVSGVLGSLLGSMLVGFTCTFGCKSGLRQPVINRFFFGWHFSKVCSVLTLVIECGYGVVTCTIAGEFLNAMFGFPVEAGITVCCGLSCLIAVMGIGTVHIWEKVVWVPISMCFLIVTIVASSDFNLAVPTQDSRAVLAGKSLTFFTLCFTENARWACIASDYYIAFPQNSSSFKLFAYTTIGIFIPSVLVGSLAIGTGTGLLFGDDGYHVDFRVNYAVYGYPSLIMDALRDSEDHGERIDNTYILIILFFSLVSSNTLNVYSFPFAIQTLHHSLLRIPQWFLTLLGGSIIYIVSMTGQRKLADNLLQFLPMIGYWVIIMATVMLEEWVLFRHGKRHRFHWRTWNDREKLTNGYAAALTFCAGVVGAIMGMKQHYFAGPIAKLARGDVGIWLTLGFTAFLYPPARLLELRYQRT